MSGQRKATRDDRAGGVGARHSLTSLHASGLHGLHHIHGRATTGPMAHQATGAREGMAIGELLLLLLLLLLLAIGERLA
jgi:hypothetical protein